MAGAGTPHLAAAHFAAERTRRGLQIGKLVITFRHASCVLKGCGPLLSQRPAKASQNGIASFISAFLAVAFPVFGAGCAAVIVDGPPSQPMIGSSGFSMRPYLRCL